MPILGLISTPRSDDLSPLSWRHFAPGQNYPICQALQLYNEQCTLGQFLLHSQKAQTPNRHYQDHSRLVSGV